MKVSVQFCSRALWTWPPWVICISLLSHKIGNAAHSGVSEVLLFTKSHKWRKKWITGRLLSETMYFWRSPADPTTTEIITPRYFPESFWLFSVISLQHFLGWKFRYYVFGIKHVFTYLLTIHPADKFDFLVIGTSHLLVVGTGDECSPIYWFSIPAERTQ